jgi:hypothetical protein
MQFLWKQDTSRPCINVRATVLCFGLTNIWGCWCALHYCKFCCEKLHTTLFKNFTEHFCISFKSFVRYFNKSSYTALVLQLLPYVSYIYNNHFHAFFTWGLKWTSTPIFSVLWHIHHDSINRWKLQVLSREEKNFLNNSNRNPQNASVTSTVLSKDLSILRKSLI